VTGNPATAAAIDLIAVEPRYPDQALLDYQRRLSAGVSRVMPRLLARCQSRTGARDDAALDLFHRLPAAARGQIVHHPFFCTWWVKVRASFATGDRAALAAQLAEFPRFVLLPSLAHGCADGIELELPSDVNGEVRFPGWPNHVTSLFEPRVLVRARVSGTALQLTAGTTNFTIDAQELLGRSNLAPIPEVVVRRTIGAGAVELDASDPWIAQLFTALNAKPLIPGSPPRGLAPYEPVDERTVGYFAQALSMLDRCCPPFASEIRSYVPLIVPCVSKALSTFTDTGFFGAIFMSELRAPFSDQLLTAEHMLHEASHLRLTLLMEEDPLIGQAPDGLVESPWRRDLRPTHQILHGSFVFARISQFLQTALELEQRPGYLRRYREVQADLRAGVRTLLTSGAEFTRAGEALIEAISATAEL
jgi:HEXXH motif-containing protein